MFEKLEVDEKQKKFDVLNVINSQVEQASKCGVTQVNKAKTHLGKAMAGFTLLFKDMLNTNDEVLQKIKALESRVKQLEGDSNVK